MVHSPAMLPGLLLQVTSQDGESSPKVSTQLQSPSCFSATTASQKYLFLPPSCPTSLEAYKATQTCSPKGPQNDFSKTEYCAGSFNDFSSTPY